MTKDATTLLEPIPSMDFREGQEHYGVVLLIDWLTLPTGDAVRGIAGYWSAAESKVSLGFAPRDQQNWSVYGHGATEAIAVFGCRVAGFWPSDPAALSDEKLAKSNFHRLS